jgi:hypothetical protein
MNIKRAYVVDDTGRKHYLYPHPPAPAPVPQGHTVSEEWRKKPSRNWETSYTKRVCDAVEAHFESLWRWYCMPIMPLPKRIQAALDLLKDYHESMHHVYEARDKLRAQVQQLLKEHTRLSTEVMELKRTIAEAKRTLS